MVSQPERCIEFGPFRLDPSQRLLFRGTEIVALTPKAIETLIVLVERQGQLVGKDELLRRVWPDTFVEEGTIARNISFLRRALGDSGDGSEYIETHSKRGYRFVAEVREVDKHAGPARESLPEAAGAPRSGKPSAARMKRIAALAGTGVLLLAAGLGGFYRSRSHAGPSEHRIMLAVLPFENLSGDPEQEYFSNGLTEEMITQLGRLEPGRLGVIARTSIMKYKGARKDAGEIGRALGANYILEGSVRREGSRVRIAAQLIETGDQSHVWAEDYDRELRDILAVQSEVSAAIAQQIQVKLTPEEHARLGRASAVNPEAYESYLKGRYFWNKRTVEGHKKAIAFFENAVRLDANYAQAYSGLADAYALLGSWPNSDLPRGEAMARARDAAKKALALDESLADAHASLGFVEMHYDWDFAGAEKEFLRATALNPGYATAHHWYAYDLVALGRVEEAVGQARLAQQADPLSAIITRDTGEMLLFAGHNDEAIAECRKALELDANFGLAHSVMAWAYHRKGQQKEFLEELGRAGDSPGPSATAVLCALTGQRAKARQKVAALQREHRARYGLSSNLTAVYAWLGEKDRAFGFLEKSFQERDGSLILMRVAPELEPLRSDARFEQIARRVGVLP